MNALLYFRSNLERIALLIASYDVSLCISTILLNHFIVSEEAIAISTSKILQVIVII